MRVRTFGVVDPIEGTAFLRGVAAWNVRDNVWLETTGAWFGGRGPDLLGRFTDRDFVTARVRWYF